MYEDTLRHAGQHVDKSRIRPFFEVSENDYEHCHLIVGWKQPSKCAKFHKIIQGWQKEVNAAQRSNKCHYIPFGDKEAAKAGGPYNVMLKYLTDPSKEKTVDESGITWTALPVVTCAVPSSARNFWQKLQWELLPRIDYYLRNPDMRSTVKWNKPFEGQAPAKRPRVGPTSE